MLRTLRRRNQRNLTGMFPNKADSRGNLRLEQLEKRVLLDTVGWWDEIGWRSASGGGATWDRAQDAYDSELVLSADGDPVLIWVEGTLSEFTGGNDGSGRIPFHFEATGEIYARQYGGEDLGWWDLVAGSGDTESMGTGSEMEAASGPNGEIAVTWVSEDNNIYVKLWDGVEWRELSGSATDTGISGADLPNVIEEEGELSAIQSEKPSIAFTESGEIFVSYTAVHPVNGQRDIVVKKYGYE